MNVLLVNGSPHREGCTHTALCTVSGALRQNGIGTDLFWIGTKPLSGCLACHRCDTLNQCVLQDTVNDFLTLAGAYDGFVFGTPVHWGGAGGAITSFLDRAFYADLNGGGHRFLGKPAAAVISARRAGTTPEEVRQDLEGIQTLELLGHNMAYFLKCREAGEKLGIPAPPQRPFVYTNFIREESHA